MYVTPGEVILHYLENYKEMRTTTSTFKLENKFYHIGATFASAKVLAVVSGWHLSESSWSLDLIVVFYLVIIANPLDFSYTNVCNLLFC